MQSVSAGTAVPATSPAAVGGRRTTSSTASVGGKPEDVLIGPRATEAEVKQLSAAGHFAEYRLLHFSTHVTLASQLSGTREPGLILTPLATATSRAARSPA